MVNRKCQVLRADKSVNFSGTLLTFGFHYEGAPDGVGHYTTAIVEKENGEVVSVELSSIRLLPKE